MIELKNVKFKYSTGTSFALNDVSINFPQGKYTAILGHNGSGKSTLSKIIAGLYKPTSGDVYIDGIKLQRSTLRKLQEKIGIIFQNPDNQFIGATVEDDIAFGLENKLIPRNEMKKIILDLSKRVGMDKYLDREPQYLSGGQKQRVAIASILALDPEIIIFDEVTSMLDPKGKKEVLKLIREIQQTRKKTLISITHDMDEAILADRVLVLAEGELIASGDPLEILKNERVIEIAKIDSPFIYRVSKLLKNVDPTYDQDKLIGEICK
ncbi:energy-coupling factor transporter ATPase [[Mycoplasma] mobile]